MDCSLGKIWSDYAQLLASRKSRVHLMNKHAHEPKEKDRSLRSSNFQSFTQSSDFGSFYKKARTSDSRRPLPTSAGYNREWAQLSADARAPQMSTNGNGHSSWQREPSPSDRQERPHRFQTDYSCIPPLHNASSHPYSTKRNPRGSSASGYYDPVRHCIPVRKTHGKMFPHSNNQHFVLPHKNQRESSVKHSPDFSTPQSRSDYSHTQPKSHLAAKQLHYPGPAVVEVPFKSSSALRNGHMFDSAVSEASIVVIESLALTEMKERANMLKKLEDMQRYRRKFILGALPESPEFVLARSIQNMKEADMKDLDSISTELMETDLESDYDDYDTEPDTEEEEYYQLMTNN